MGKMADNVANRRRFLSGMAALCKAHLLQVDREHVAIYFESISSELSFEAFEFAVKESIRLDDRFPKVPRLLELGKRFRPPVAKADLARPALPEFTAEQHEQARQQFQELLDKFENWDGV